MEELPVGQYGEICILERLLGVIHVDDGLERRQGQGGHEEAVGKSRCQVVRSEPG